LVRNPLLGALPVRHNGCRSLESDLLAIPAAHRDSAVIIWASGQGNAECMACLIAAAPEYGFASAYQDDRFQFFVPAAAE